MSWSDRPQFLGTLARCVAGLGATSACDTERLNLIATAQALAPTACSGWRRGWARALPAVTYLHINGMRTGDAGASALAAALGRGFLPRLEHLTSDQRRHRRRGAGSPRRPCGGARAGGGLSRGQPSRRRGPRCPRGAAAAAAGRWPGAPPTTTVGSQCYKRSSIEEQRTSKAVDHGGVNITPKAPRAATHQYCVWPRPRET